MNLDKRSKIAIYTANADGLFDELVIDFFNKFYVYSAGIDERDLIKAHDGNIPEFCVGKEILDTFFRIIENLYCGEYRFEEIGYDYRAELEKEYNAKEASKPVIAKEKVWQALRGELSLKELKKVRAADCRYEKDDYYDFDLAIRTVYDLMYGRITISYFVRWCGVLIGCLMDYMNCKNEKLSSVFKETGWYLDGVVFDGSFIARGKARECRKIIAHLKYFDHVIRDLKSKLATDFTTNGVITYVSFGFGLNGGNGSVYRVCIVDKTRKAINYMYVPKIGYSGKVNYTFLSEAEFDELSNRYYDGYFLDYSMGPEYAAKAARPVQG